MWSLLRIWHAEAIESVIQHPQGVHFLRTSYLTAPEQWRNLPQPELVNRVEQLLNASYRRRNWSTAQSDDPTPMVPFAFYFEWVDLDDSPAITDTRVAPWVLPNANAHPNLVENAIADIDARLQTVRPGINARAYSEAFSVFRIDPDDTWHLIDDRDRAALFADRFGHVR
jgi:hypothetical protein